MIYQCSVKNGLIQLPTGTEIPDGASVSVVFPGIDADHFESPNFPPGTTIAQRPIRTKADWDEFMAEMGGPLNNDPSFIRPPQPLMPEFEPILP
jgi:hypothetical protein